MHLKHNAQMHSELSKHPNLASWRRRCLAPLSPQLPPSAQPCARHAAGMPLWSACWQHCWVHAIQLNHKESNRAARSPLYSTIPSHSASEANRSSNSRPSVIGALQRSQPNTEIELRSEAVIFLPILTVRCFLLHQLPLRKLQLRPLTGAQNAFPTSNGTCSLHKGPVEYTRWRSDLAGQPMCCKAF